MKTSALATLAVAALLALTVPACAGPAATPVNDVSPAASGTATAAPIVTPTPIPKAYTNADLAGIVRQVRDSADRRLTVLPETDLAATIEQSKEMVAAIEVAPAACKEFATASTVPALDGAAMAMGLSTDSGTGAVTALSLLSGLDEAALANVADPAAQLQQCSDMTVTVSGIAVPVTIAMLDSVGGLAETTAYRTETQLPDGQVQSTITAQAIQQGVVLTAVATGGESETDAATRAGALLDAAAAFIK
ncbi:hypothetical protein FDW83_05845 [Pseudarthrobacter sp. NamE2]|uniref:hypothetical protein n=1 Tax=Pseudarthrobacter sp. NamE2 TaxID=2576838 RepID=UPI0010FED96E|nr:hypothetical protein [Pseudarthrobacter sp. NamE2]TLM84920.1 hypothetical protein FDW83_05845 [Pseudarthrobacter sp. NamE2]